MAVRYRSAMLRAWAEQGLRSTMQRRSNASEFLTQDTSLVPAILPPPLR